VLFWVTPIVWPANIVSAEYSWILTSNPIYFVVETYRRSLISGMPDFEFNAITLVASVTLAAAICATLYKHIKKVNDFV
jgi:ABC-type polysaccharide/polyol phosphate export permease